MAPFATPRRAPRTIAACRRLEMASGGHASPDVLAKPQTTGIWGFIFALFASYAWLVVFTTLQGSTVGNIALSMVVVLQDGSPCGFKSALIHEPVDFVDALFFGIVGYAARRDDPKPQRHGDEWARIIVSRRPLIPPHKLRGGDPSWLLWVSP